MYPGRQKEEIPQFVPPPPPPAFISQSSPWQLLDKIFGSGPAFSQNNQGFNSQAQIPHGFTQNNPFAGGYQGNNQSQQPLNFPSNPFEGPVFPSGFDGNPNKR